MTAFQIKLVAIITMVIDHIGIFLFPQLIILRIIGRLSFSLFAWLIANGAHHSKNKMHYLMRLLIVGVISQIPYSALYQIVQPGEFHLNIFFTLFLGLGAIILCKKYTALITKLLIVAAFSLIALILQCEYGAAGVLSIFFFYIYFKDFKMILFTQSLIIFAFYTIPLSIFIFSNTSKVIYINSIQLIQPLALLFFVFIVRYNLKEGTRIKRLLYFFYPLHLLIIYFVK